MGLQEKIAAEVDSQEERLKKEVEEARQKKIEEMQAMTAEINMIRQKAYSFEELMEFLRMLHEAGGDEVVAQYLLIYGEVSKIDDSIEELEFIEDALCSYDDEFMFGFQEGRKYPEHERLLRRKKELLKKRNSLTNTIGMMDNSMFGFRKHHSKYRRY